MAATLPPDANQHEGHQVNHAPPSPEPGQGPGSTGPGSGRKTTRRQWSIQEGPRGILRRMRSQLAEDGCSESQLVIGKTLLESLSEETEQDEEGARLAVYWLTRSSLQGNLEATTLLQDCLDKNIGICEHNYHEVRECLTMDQQEKLARRAARLLFTSLSDGNDFITSSRLSARMQTVIAGVEHVDDLETPHATAICNDLEERYGGERFSEEHLVSAGAIYCAGRVPPLHHFLSITRTPHQHPLLKGVSWPLRFVSDTYHTALHFLSVVLTNLFLTFLNILSPFTGSVILCLVSFFVSLIGVNRAIAVLPSLVSCVSLLVMLMSSAHMLLNKKCFDNFQTWSVIFSHHCPELDTERAEERFKVRCWKPHLVLFMSVVIYLGTVPLVPQKLVVCFLPVMYVCTVLTLFLVPEKLKLWQFISLGVYVMAVTPNIHSSINNWFLTISLGSGIDSLLVDQHMDIGGHIKLHTGVGPLLHLLWVCVLVSVTVFGRLSALPSHLVTIIWCHLAIMASYQVSHPTVLLYPLAAWSLIIVLPTLTTLVGVFGPGVLYGYLCLQVGFDTQVALFVFASILVVTCVLKYWLPKCLTLLKLLMALGILIAIIQPDLILALPRTLYSSLQWESYKNVCVPSEDSGATTVHGCLPLQGMMVKWRGSVAAVDIASVTNVPQLVVSVLPVVLSKPIQCYLGVTLPQCPTGKGTEFRKERCQLVHSVLGSNACTLENWNEYNFDIKVAMTSSMWEFTNEENHVKLQADNTFKKFALGLRVGDEVEFVGSLTEGIGTHQPKLHLSSISCVNCKAKMPSTEKRSVNVNFDIWIIPTFIFNFFMGPTLTI